MCDDETYLAGNLPSDSTSISGGLDSYNNISEPFAGHHGSSSFSVLNYDNDSEDVALPNPEVYTGTVANDQVAGKLSVMCCVITYQLHVLMFKI